MKRIVALAGAALLAFSAVATPSSANNAMIGGAPVFGAPQVVDPVCLPGFVTVQKLSWILRCRAVVPQAQAAATVAQAQGANCNTWSYWNYGPAVTSSAMRGSVTVEYICGHVEG
ncbi:MAG: hypothetical protein KIS96_06105 [Bauldia sp.]|nr:hypothetical protein [Bauldia sp.]